jgi:hypothetical protein
MSLVKLSSRKSVFAKLYYLVLSMYLVIKLYFYNTDMVTKLLCVVISSVNVFNLLIVLAYIRWRYKRDWNNMYVDENQID